MPIDRSKYRVNSHVPKTKHYSTKDWVTPAVFDSEGINPNGQWNPAPYLPIIRQSGVIDAPVVISEGKVLALTSDGHLVPAGILQSDAVYTDVDVKEGVMGPDGEPVEAGQSVKDKMTAAGITVSAPVGLAFTDYMRHPGGDPLNPTTFNFANYNLQARVTFNCDYVVKLPVVESRDVYKKAPLPGIAAFIAAKGGNFDKPEKLSDITTVKPGDFVTFDEDSNMKVTTETGLDKVVGQVIQVIPQDPNCMLKWVRTANFGDSPLDVAPGSGTGGKGHAIAYSGGYCSVRVNIITR